MRESWQGTAWMARGACRGRDPGPWMSTLPALVAEARAVCRGCPVNLRCLQYAVDFEQQTLVAEPLMFGGRTPAERMVMLSRRRRP